MRTRRERWPLPSVCTTGSGSRRPGTDAIALISGTSARDTMVIGAGNVPPGHRVWIRVSHGHGIHDALGPDAPHTFASASATSPLPPLAIASRASRQRTAFDRIVSAAHTSTGTHTTITIITMLATAAATPPPRPSVNPNRCGSDSSATITIGVSANIAMPAPIRIMRRFATLADFGRPSGRSADSTCACSSPATRSTAPASPAARSRRSAPRLPELLIKAAGTMRRSRGSRRPPSRTSPHRPSRPSRGQATRPPWPSRAP